MSKRLRSVGLDVGTTSTQMILSELVVEDRAGAFSVPEMAITQRRILYESPVFFTPLVEENLVNGAEIRRIVEQEYKNAGISRADVDTGAIIITGESSRKENARAVLEALSDLAGDFVVATAGPDLESVLAAKGAGADTWSERTGKCVLHIDIGGGTSNFAWIREGKVWKTGCLNVGGRLIKLDESGTITYISPVLQGITELKVGDKPTLSQVEDLAQVLTHALEMAAGLREPDGLLRALTTRESVAFCQGFPHFPMGEPFALSFSGGVAACMDAGENWRKFGDIGPVLARAIRAGRLCSGEFRLPEAPIRATVIGAGCHSTQLSGSTVFHQNLPFPLKNLPVAPVAEPEAGGFDLPKNDGMQLLALPKFDPPGYRRLAAIADKISAQTTSGPLLLVMEQDMAKALGQALSARLPRGTPLLCIDRVRVEAGSYLDIGAPVGQALPVVIKTLVLGKD